MAQAARRAGDGYSRDNVMAFVGVAVGVVALWLAARWLGRGRPCPVLLAAFFDNSVVDRLSGVQTLLDRADVRSGMRVLDAGCGPGRLTIPLGRRVGEGGDVVALDVQPGMLERVRRNATRAGVNNVRTVLGALEHDAPALAQEREAFDRILLVTVLGEIPRPDGALRTLHAALKPDGILSVTETIIDPDYVSRVRVKRLATEAGFRLAEQFGPALAFTLNFRKGLI